MDIIFFILIGVAAGAVGQQLGRTKSGGAGVSMGFGIVGAFGAAFVARMLGLGGAVLLALSTLGAAAAVAIYYWLLGPRPSV